jgi:hypothetical protein
LKDNYHLVLPPVAQYGLSKENVQAEDQPIEPTQGARARKLIVPVVLQQAIG